MRFFEFVISLPVYFIYGIIYVLFILPISIFSMIGKIRIKQNEKTKKRWKEFGMKFSVLLASFGIAFFIIAHLWFVPIAERMRKDYEKVRERIEKGKKFGKKDIFTPRRSFEFPPPKIYKT